jgi:maltose-binding protein MalE
MFKRISTLLALILIGVIVLSACGGGEEPTVAPTQAPVVQPTDAPAEEPTEEVMEEPTEEVMEEPTEEVMEEPEVFITIWSDDTRTPILLELAEEFEATYGVGLVVEQVADIRDQFVIAAPAGEGPDIIIGAHDWLGQLVSSGLLAEIDLGDKSDAFLPAAVEGFTYDGTLYGMPYAIENLAFFYNTELVPEAPSTWEKVVEIGSALVESGDATYGLALTGTTYDAFPLQTAFGGYIFGQDADGNYDPSDVGIGSEGMIAAGNWIQDNVESGFLADNIDWDTGHTLFETGEVPFLIAGPWALDRIRNSGVPYAISTFPAADAEGRSFLGVQGFMVNALSDNVLLAQTFLTEFVATEETMQALQDAGNRPAALLSVYEAIDDPDLAIFGEAGANAVLMPAIPEMGSVWGSWGDAFALIISGEEEPEAALTTAQGQIVQLISGDLDYEIESVNVPGSFQAAAGCPTDWDPACEATNMTLGDDGLWTLTVELPAGDYEGKVAINGGWTINFGLDGELDGANYTFSLASDGTVTFTFDPTTNLLEITIE